jgi:hypothetical protein
VVVLIVVVMLLEGASNSGKSLSDICEGSVVGGVDVGTAFCISIYLVRNNKYELHINISAALICPPVFFLYFTLSLSKRTLYILSQIIAEFELRVRRPDIFVQAEEQRQQQSKIVELRWCFARS